MEVDISYFVGNEIGETSMLVSIKIKKACILGPSNFISRNLSYKHAHKYTTE